MLRVKAWRGVGGTTKGEGPMGRSPWGACVGAGYLARVRACRSS
jgi:hypothetical protein